MQQKKIFLTEKDIPRQWYNIAADLPRPLPPPLHPGTLQPLGPQDLAPIFPMPLIEQEVSTQRWIDIPEPVLDVLALWRPTPLVRAYALEAALGTPAQIWFKNESVSPSGSHKTNTAIAQAYYNKITGVKRLATETGAGQWGSALAFSCVKLGLMCTVYMVRVSYDQKPYRKAMMHTWGAEVFPSPSDKTNAGRAMLAADPNSRGSLGMAISEAVEDAATHDDTKYALGSVLNHVLLHQTIIGLETKKQFALAGVKPDVLVGCTGGGSNFAGFAFPFLADKIAGTSKVTCLCAEPAACPSLTRGTYTYDFGDTAKLTPLVKMYTLGHGFVPPGIHAGGLRYHGMAPIVSALVDERLMEARAVHQLSVFEAAMVFARTEGIIPAPESSHAIRVVIDEALEAKKTGQPKVIGFILSGHGHFDMGSYEAFFAGKLEDYEYPAQKIAEALADLPKV